jgi:hypothetical protein
LPIFRFGGPFSEQRRSKERELRHKRQELRKIRDKERATKEKVERKTLKKRKKKIQQELFRLKGEVRAAKDATEGAPGGWAAPQAEEGPEGGALPDFAIIGGKKCGTTYLYHLLTQHPHVEPAAFKEPHFFDSLFEEGVEWYRRCFPTPRWKDGRRNITGEATPYMPGRRIPERMAQVVPQARLIALLRNPVDRAYSDYQQVARTGRETRTFEEAIGVMRQRSLSQEDEASDGKDSANLDEDSEYLSRGVYVDQLLRWSKFFPKEQMLVLKSEDLFEHQRETLKRVLAFLKLPDWEPEAAGPQRPRIPTFRNKRDKRNKGRYEEKMDPATRRRLERYFEPHNRRLYDYLSVDFGW